MTGTRGGRGALYVIAVTLLLSAGLRFWTHEAQAIARDGNPAGAPPACNAPPGVGEALAAIRDREERADETDLMIEERLRILALAEDRVTLQLRELREAEEALRLAIAAAETAAEDDLSQLTSVYENMKPKEAAAIFGQMTPEFAAGFLGRMRPDAAAGIMSGLPPEKAYAISVLLAGRNAAVPGE